MGLALALNRQANCFFSFCLLVSLQFYSFNSSLSSLASKLYAIYSLLLCLTIVEMDHLWRPWWCFLCLSRGWRNFLALEVGNKATAWIYCNECCFLLLLGKGNHFGRWLF